MGREYGHISITVQVQLQLQLQLQLHILNDQRVTRLRVRVTRELFPKLTIEKNASYLLPTDRTDRT